MSASEQVNIIRQKLIDFATEQAENGVRIKSVRFTYNVNNHCTQALMSYEEESPDFLNPLKMSEL